MIFIDLVKLFFRLKKFTCMNKDEDFIISSEYFEYAQINNNSKELITEKFGLFNEKLNIQRQSLLNLLEIYEKYRETRKIRKKYKNEKFDLELLINPEEKINFDSFIINIFKIYMQDKIQNDFFKDNQYFTESIDTVDDIKRYPYIKLHNLAIDLPRIVLKNFCNNYLNKLDYIDNKDNKFIFAKFNYKSTTLKIFKILRNYRNSFNYGINYELEEILKKLIDYTDIIFKNINLNNYSYEEYVKLFKTYVYIKLGLNSLSIFCICINSHEFSDEILIRYLKENDNCILMLLYNFYYLNNYEFNLDK